MWEQCWCEVMVSSGAHVSGTVMKWPKQQRGRLYDLMEKIEFVACSWWDPKVEVKLFSYL